MKILALLHDRTFPARSGTRVRNHHLWPAVSKIGPEVRIIGLDLKPDRTTALGPPGISSEYFGAKRAGALARATGALLHTYHEWPRSTQIDAEVDHVVREWKPDVIHAEELRMASYLPALRRTTATRGDGKSAVQTLTLHNVESDLRRRTGSTAMPMGRSLIHICHDITLRRYERRAVEAVDIVFAYSPADLNRYKQLYPMASWSVTQNGTNASQIVPTPLPHDRRVLILGTLSYVPNIDGLYWFLDKVRPLLAKGVSVTVAGANAPQSVRDRLGTEPVTFLDTPAELAPVYAAHTVCAIPLLDGSGTRGRILEALAFERPVVTTTKGAEGLNIDPASGVIIADDPAAFAESLNQWTLPSEDHLKQACLGRKFVLEHYDWSVVAARLVADWTACISR